MWMQWSQMKHAMQQQQHHQHHHHQPIQNQKSHVWISSVVTEATLDQPQLFRLRQERHWQPPQPHPQQQR